MSKSNIIEMVGREASADPLTELLRTSAYQLIYQAVFIGKKVLYRPFPKCSC